MFCCGLLDVDLYALVITTPGILNAPSFILCFLLSIARHFLFAEVKSANIIWFCSHICQQMFSKGNDTCGHLKAGICWLTCSMVDWLTDSFTGWLTSWLAYWLTDRFAEQLKLVYGLNFRLIDWHSDCLTGWLSGWLTDWHWFADRPTNVGLLSNFRADWLVRWLINKLTY